METLKKERKFTRDKDLKEREEQAHKLQSDQYNFTQVMSEKIRVEQENTQVKKRLALLEEEERGRRREEEHEHSLDTQIKSKQAVKKALFYQEKYEEQKRDFDEVQSQLNSANLQVSESH